MKPRYSEYIQVVVNFLSQVIFVLLLFLGMVMYANEVETKEKEKLPEKKKNNYNIYISSPLAVCKHFESLR